MSKVRARTDEGTPASKDSPTSTSRPLPPPILLPPPTRARTPPVRISPAPPPVRSDDDPATPAWVAAVKVGLALAAAIIAFGVITRLQPNAPRAEPAAALTDTAPPRDLPGLPAMPKPGDPKQGPLSPEDWAFLRTLSARLQSPQAPLPTDPEMARLEDIFRRSENDAQVRAFLVGTYLLQADRALQAGSFASLDQALLNLKALDDHHPPIYEMEAFGKVRQGDWATAEAAARKYEALAGERLGVSMVLAMSLHNLGRKPEALAVLDRPVFASCPTASSPSDLAACRSAQQLRASLASTPEPERPEKESVRPRAALNVDPSKEQIQSERFDIRFNGENQTGVARDVLFVLDRAYVRLANIYYERPSRKIPVVLHASQDYQSATGAPWWSGGQYSSHNGAIQIPIRGMPKTLPREMEDVLVHELSHAFVDDMSGGQAGRDLQEGLAQFMEGKRIEEVLGPAELKRLANSGQKTVMNFYMLSLAVSEQLVQSRGQNAINQLLKAMKETGSEDGGFKKVFGLSGADMKKDILVTFWRRYS